MIFKGSVILMEAINKFYLNNGVIYPISDFSDEDYNINIVIYNG